MNKYTPGFFALAAFLVSCGDNQYQYIEGQTMGTAYHITAEVGGQIAVDSLLSAINKEVNTYDPGSVISLLNTARDTFFVSQNARHFWQNWSRAEEVYNASSGFFDPTIMPLVNYWGFGPALSRLVSMKDSSVVDSLMRFVGFSRFEANLEQGWIVKPDPRSELDFSAIAKGYAVDQVGELLERQGASNFMVEIGGEVLVKGVNPKGQEWRIAINEPLPDSDPFVFADVISISNLAMASSGNYRNFKVLDGQLYGHTLNPLSGFPAENDLLGVTVLSKSCIYADAYATACMAMGYVKALAMMESLPGYEVAFYLVRSDGAVDKRYTDGFIQFLVESQ